MDSYKEIKQAMSCYRQRYMYYGTSCADLRNKIDTVLNSIIITIRDQGNFIPRESAKEKYMLGISNNTTKANEYKGQVDKIMPNLSMFSSKSDIKKFESLVSAFAKCKAKAEMLHYKSQIKNDYNRLCAYYESVSKKYYAYLILASLYEKFYNEGEAYLRNVG